MEILSVGTELLLGQIIDTHAPAMAKILAECGISCQRRVTIGDNFDRLTSAVKESLSRVPLLITIGGLGPTGDDLTRDAVAAALGEELREVPEEAAKLRAFFAERGIKMPDSNLRQASKPDCADLIENPYGTAPGLLCRKDGCTVICLPGPADEFNPMANGPVRTFLSSAGGGSGTVIHSRVVRAAGIGESSVEEMLKPLMDGENPTLAPYAHTGEVHLRITARAASVEEADRLIDPMESQIREILGDAVYGTNDTTLAQSVLQLLEGKGLTLATAESITGGLIGGRLTAIPGSSRVYRGGAVTYAVPVKEKVLGVPTELLKAHGPVSAETAAAMAQAAQKVFEADYAVSSVGNAGPGADVDGKPVGRVYIAAAGPNGQIKVQEGNYRGIRENIRERTVQLALTSLRALILGH